MMPVSTTPKDGQAIVLSYDRACGERSLPESSIHGGFPSMDPSAPPTLRAGIYQHFKGKKYAVVGVAPVVDSDEFFVVYRPLYGDRKLVLRPYAEFIGTVTREGRTQPRFVFVEPENNPESKPSSLGLWGRLWDIVFRKRFRRLFRKHKSPKAGDQQHDRYAPQPHV
jgi:hypothetical protein